MSRILPLPADAISQIHSSKHITSLQGVVLALLENSLDAGSSKVEITVDFRRGGCTIEDNGTGIPPAEFREGGGLGKMYHTSKRNSSAEHELHGSSGTYLASLGALSLLSITSHHGNYAEHATITIHQGKVIERKISALLGHEHNVSAASGSRVTVRDLFGNMPVRVKQRALAADTIADNERAWQELKRGIVGLLIAWHMPCSVRVRDAERDSSTLNLAPQHPAVSAALTEKSLNQLAGGKTKFNMKDVLPVLFQVGLAPLESRNDWIPVSAASSNLSVKGLICLHPVPTKQCQFISIGIHPCSTHAGHGEIYEVVNKSFANSSFGAIEDDSEADEAEKDRRKHDRRYKHDGYTQRQLHGRKSVDRWPMFVLKVAFRDQQRTQKTTADNVSATSLKSITEILEATVRQWLEAHHFRPRRKRRRRNEEQQSPTVASGTQSPASVSSHDGVRRQTQTVVTPLNRRSATVETATTSKKRKILDFSSRLRNDAGRSTSLHTPNECFNSWSCIKSGRESFYEEIWEGKRPATAPEGRQTPKASSVEVPKLTFDTPALDTGELSSYHPNRSKITIYDSPNHENVAAQARTRRTQHTSSEDFGSVDDDGMLIAVDKAENPRKLNKHDQNEADEHEENSNMEEQFLNDSVMEWTDPVTTQTYRVNARTGVVLPSRPKSNPLDSGHLGNDGTLTRQSAAINTSVSAIGRPLTLSKRPSTTSRERQENWLPGFLKEWNNPVFTRQDEERIPVASLDGPGIEVTEAATKRRTHDASTSYYAEAGVAGTSKLSKAALKEANVIRQVDQKFILCKMKEGSSEVLVIVDQHAASERLILEGLLDELCTPVAPTESRSKVQTVHLEKPLHFHISPAEHQLFDTYKLHFAEWGILYDLQERQEDKGASQIRAPKQEHFIIVKTLLPGIAERCILNPKLLIELLRSEVWKITSLAKRSGTMDHDSIKPQSGNELNDEGRAWLRRIGSCPKGILDMMNSRACRSAIMFNDELSMEQCEELLSELSRCAFPFMCAHGRVSMVPLVQLVEESGGLSTLNSDGHGLTCHEGNEGEKYSEAFHRWKTKESLDIVAKTSE